MMRFLIIACITIAAAIGLAAFSVFLTLVWVQQGPLAAVGITLCALWTVAAVVVLAQLPQSK